MASWAWGRTGSPQRRYPASTWRRTYYATQHEVSTHVADQAIVSPEFCRRQRPGPDGHPDHGAGARGDRGHGAQDRGIAALGADRGFGVHRQVDRREGPQVDRRHRQVHAGPLVLAGVRPYDGPPGDPRPVERARRRAVRRRIRHGVLHRRGVFSGRHPGPRSERARAHRSDQGPAERAVWTQHVRGRDQLHHQGADRGPRSEREGRLRRQWPARLLVVDRQQHVRRQVRRPRLRARLQVRRRVREPADRQEGGIRVDQVGRAHADLAAVGRFQGHRQRDLSFGRGRPAGPVPAGRQQEQLLPGLPLGRVSFGRAGLESVPVLLRRHRPGHRAAQHGSCPGHRGPQPRPGFRPAVRHGHQEPGRHRIRRRRHGGDLRLAAPRLRHRRLGLGGHLALGLPRLHEPLRHGQRSLQRVHAAADLPPGRQPEPERRPVRLRRPGLAAGEGAAVRQHEPRQRHQQVHGTAPRQPAGQAHPRHGWLLLLRFHGPQFRPHLPAAGPGSAQQHRDGEGRSLLRPRGVRHHRSAHADGRSPPHGRNEVARRSSAPRIPPTSTTGPEAARTSASAARWPQATTTTRWASGATTTS